MEYPLAEIVVVWLKIRINDIKYLYNNHRYYVVVWLKIRINDIENERL